MLSTAAVPRRDPVPLRTRGRAYQRLQAFSGQSSKTGTCSLPACLQFIVCTSHFSRAHRYTHMCKHGVDLDTIAKEASLATGLLLARVKRWFYRAISTRRHSGRNPHHGSRGRPQERTGAHKPNSHPRTPRKLPQNKSPQLANPTQDQHSREGADSPSNGDTLASLIRLLDESAPKQESASIRSADTSGWSRPGSTSFSADTTSSVPSARSYNSAPTQPGTPVSAVATDTPARAMQVRDSNCVHSQSMDAFGEHLGSLNKSATKLLPGGIHCTESSTWSGTATASFNADASSCYSACSSALFDGDTASCYSACSFALFDDDAASRYSAWSNDGTV